MKRVCSVILIIAMVLSLCACRDAETGYGVGHGEPGVVAEIDWSGFDTLVKDIQFETDLDKRALLMHDLEDMIMDTGLVIPLYYMPHQFLVKPEVKGLSKGYADSLYVAQAYKEGSSVLNVCMGGEEATLDPGTRPVSSLECYASLIFGGLMAYNSDKTAIFEFAQDLDISEDGLTYTFTMREGLKWSDGTPLDARDFEYSWKRLTNVETGSQCAFLLNMIEGYPNDLNVKSSKDGRKFIVKLSAPCAYFTSLCSSAYLSPVPKQDVEKNTSVNPFAWSAEAGFACCGPYVVDKWVHNESLVLKKNPYYWNADAIKAETINIMLNGDGNIAYAAYLAGDLDVTFLFPSSVLKEYVDSPELYSIEAVTTDMIIFSSKSSIFAGMTTEEAADFRKALSYAIDREFLTQIVSDGMNIPAASYIPPYCSCCCEYDFSNCPGYEYPVDGGYYKTTADLDASRRLLSSIGFEFGDDGKLKYPVSFNITCTSSTSTLMSCLQADFAQLGIVAKVATVDQSIYWNEMVSGNFEASRSNWSEDFDDVMGMMEPFYPGSSNNWFQLGK